MDRLKEKVAIVTGAGSRGPGIGNGKAAAVLFAREGAHVLCVDQFLDRAEETCALIRDRKSTRLNSSHIQKSRMPSSA